MPSLSYLQFASLLSMYSVHTVANVHIIKRALSKPSINVPHHLIQSIFVQIQAFIPLHRWLLKYLRIYALRSLAYHYLSSLYQWAHFGHECMNQPQNETNQVKCLYFVLYSIRLFGILCCKHWHDCRVCISPCMAHTPSSMRTEVTHCRVMIWPGT